MKPQDKLIVKHVLKSVLLYIEHSRELQEELQRNGVDYMVLTGREITKEPEYIELMETVCELAGIK